MQKRNNERETIIRIYDTACTHIMNPIEMKKKNKDQQKCIRIQRVGTLRLSTHPNVGHIDKVLVSTVVNDNKDVQALPILRISFYSGVLCGPVYCYILPLLLFMGTNEVENEYLCTQIKIESKFW